MRNQWVDIDLDYFNRFPAPMSAFEKILLSVNPKTPAFFCIDHQQVLPIIRKAIKYGTVQTPMTIFRVDDHHDYYHIKYFPKKNRDVNCGNFGFRVPVKSYNRFVWVTRKVGRDYCWPKAVKWLKEKGKIVEKLKSVCWDKKDVGLVTITVSPDFQSLEYNLSAMLELASEYFNIPSRPYVKSDGKMYYPEDWEIRDRPVCVK